MARLSSRGVKNWDMCSHTPADTRQARIGAAILSAHSTMSMVAGKAQSPVLINQLNQIMTRRHHVVPRQQARHCCQELTGCNSLSAAHPLQFGAITSWEQALLKQRSQPSLEGRHVPPLSDLVKIRAPCRQTQDLQPKVPDSTTPSSVRNARKSACVRCAAVAIATAPHRTMIVPMNSGL